MFFNVVVTLSIGHFPLLPKFTSGLKISGLPLLIIS